MSTSGTWPNFNGWLSNAWGSGQAYETAFWYPNYQIGLVFGSNPPYYLDDFNRVYPQFLGAPLQLPGQVTINTQQVTVPTTSGLTAGMFVQCTQFPLSTFIESVDSTTQITLNNPATASMVNAVINVYNNPVVPAFVLWQYTKLALNTISYDQWQGEWYFAMALFIAHYATLWAQTSALDVIQQVISIMHGEIPTGPIPGSNFTLTTTPPGGQLMGLYMNGSLLSPTTYTLIGTVLTTSFPVTSDDLLYAVWPTTTTQNTTVPMTPAQVAARALATGIQTSKSVGDVSVGYQALTALENWGAWNLTRFGQQLAQLARVQGAGMMFFW